MPLPSLLRPPSRAALAARVLPLAAVLLFFHRGALTDGLFLSRDMLRVYGPLLAFWSERIRQGRWPEWYPYDALGQPFVGVVFSRPFHPANLLALALPVFTSIKVMVLACFPLAWIGTFRLARRLGASSGGATLAALSFCFCGYLVTITNNLSYLMAAATVPWALAAVARCRSQPSPAQVGRAGFLLALLLFTGDVQSFAVTCALALGLPLLWESGPPRRAFLLRAALAVALAGSIGLVQLVPGAIIRGEGRFAQQTLAEATAWSTHPLRLVELAVGPIFAGPERARETGLISRRLLGTERSALWVGSLYLGAIPVLLAALGMWARRRDRRALGVAAASLVLLVLALGRYGGLYAVLFKLLPVWRMFRYPEKLMPFACLGLALGAGAGWQALQDDAGLRRRAGFGSILLAGLAALAWAGVRRGTSLPELLEAALGAGGRSAAEQVVAALAHSLERVALVALLVALALLAVRDAARRAALVLALVGVDLYAANAGLYQLSGPEVLEQPPALVDAIRTAGGGGIAAGGPRVYRVPGRTYEPKELSLSVATLDALEVASALEPDTPALYGLEGANVELPAASKRVISLWDDERDFVSRQAPRFGTEYFVVSREVEKVALARIGVKAAEVGPLGLSLFRSERVLPRAYLAHPRCVRDVDEAIAALRDAGFMAGREAVVECSRPLPAGGGDAPGSALIRSYTPEQVELEVDARTPALMVLNDAFYRGWSATVDGVEAELLPANVAVRGVMVEAGRHSVVMRYRTPGLRIAALLSLLAAVGAIGVGLWSARGRTG